MQDRQTVQFLPRQWIFICHLRQRFVFSSEYYVVFIQMDWRERMSFENFSTEYFLAIILTLKVKKKNGILKGILPDVK